MEWTQCREEQVNPTKWRYVEVHIEILTANIRLHRVSLHLSLLEVGGRGPLAYDASISFMGHQPMSDV